MNTRIKKKKYLNKGKIQEVWDLDSYMARYILPRLKTLKAHTGEKHPSTMSGVEEWIEILDKMIWSFEYVLDMTYDKKDIERFHEGMNLFAKHYLQLWV